MTSARHAEDPMTAETYMAWYDAQPDGTRYELLDGLPIAMASERAVHARVKARIFDQLARDIAAKRLPCEAFIDGMAVRVDDDNVFEPDALVLCGPPIADQVVLIEGPVIVVEVGSPSTQRIDATTKLTRYFRNPHIMHYLIAVPTAGSVIRHRRTETGAIATSSHESGTIRLDPAGLELTIDGLFPTATGA